jgi:hypothetical protein
VCADRKHEQIVYSPWKSTITNVGTVQNFEGISDKFSILSNTCLTKINSVLIVNKSVVLLIAAAGVRGLHAVLYKCVS